jgi:hypothetical protein
MSERLSKGSQKILEKAVHQQQLVSMDPQDRLEIEIQNLDENFARRDRFNKIITILSGLGLSSSMALMGTAHEWTESSIKLGGSGFMISFVGMTIAIISSVSNGEDGEELNRKIKELVGLNNTSASFLDTKKKKSEVKLTDDGELEQIELESYEAVSLNELTGLSDKSV